MELLILNTLNGYICGMRDHDQHFMSRCFELAMNGLGSTYPNPLVGSVLVGKDCSILGEGWHRKSGEPHAEVLAIQNAEERCGAIDYENSTLYVNLEPCSHYGKTPPCADLIKDKGIGRVVIANVDPHHKVAGKGIDRLRKAGIEVVTGVGKEQGEGINKRFFCYQRNKRPYIILKWAESADGFMAPVNHEKGKPYWITNKYTRQLVHKLRAEENAILVGSGTVRHDNPSLTVRDWTGINPTRIILDRGSTLPRTSNVFNDDSKTLQLNTDLNDLKPVMQKLFEENIQSLIVEGGAKTLKAFMEQQLFDEVHQYMSKTQLLYNGLAAPSIASILQLQDRQELHEGDILKIYVRR